MVLRRALRKQQILQAAIEVFGKSSFEKANIAEIARRAGVAEGTIYQYFKNKRDLFFSIPRERTNAFTEELELHLQGITDSREKIRRFVWYYLYFFKTNPDYARSLMLEMRVSRDFRKSGSYKGIRRFTQKVLEILREGQQQGLVRRDVDLYLARQLVLGILEHIVTRWLLKGERDDVLQYHEQVSDLILNGICMKATEECGGTATQKARRGGDKRRSRS